MKKATIALLALLTVFLAFAMTPAGAQREPEDAPKDRSDPATVVHSSLLDLARPALRRALPNGPETVEGSVPMMNGRAVVDITITGDPVETLAALEEIGFEEGAIANGLISGQLPVNQIMSVNQVPGVHTVLPAFALTNVGSVTAQSDASMRADEARSTFAIDGSGITVGALSDSFDCTGTQEAANVASGDLPSGIVVLDDSFCPSGRDEGRAMMQLIHDSAPGASQQFHTGFGGQADFATGILELAAAGSDVIVDDVFYFAEPFFQDGVIAQAVDTVAADGVVYLSSAGNAATNSYESAFTESGQTDFGGALHDFDPGTGIDTRQLIHDSAPGASQQFHTGFGGQADFATGILELAAAGSDVIVDDVFYFAEPFFQDGVIAQAVDTVAADGVVYLSSAGNAATNSYESAFTESGQTDFGGALHDFDPGTGIDTRQRIRIPRFTTASLSFQWDQPFQSISGTGATTDLDIYLLDTTGTVVASSSTGNIGGDPLEVLVYRNTTGSAELDLVIVNNSGPNPTLMKYVGFRNLDIVEWDTNSGTVVGHANAAGAHAVGAAWYVNTPEFGVAPPIVESFSATGGVPILFEVDGTPTVQDRQKPDFVAPDGVDNTFFGTDSDTNGFPNFFGTSASAPAAAGGAALILDAVPGATPLAVGTALESSAIDMAAAGFDHGTGAGLIQIDAAINQLLGASFCNGLSVTVDLSEGDTPTSGDDVILGTSGPDVIVALGGDDTICGLGGNDTINAGPGNDTVLAGDGDDTVFGLDGNDAIFGGAGSDELVGFAGDDTIIGDAGQDTINGGAGNDTATGGPDDDSLFGQAGNDALEGNGGNDFVSGLGGVDVITGGNGNDTINGGPGNDNIGGGPGDDVIFGLNGNDTLAGDAGNDEIFGQLGQDQVIGGNGDDQLLGNEDDDILTDSSGTNTINGGAGDDTITGGTGIDRIFGDGNLAHAGNDTITGGGGEDLLLGFAGNDTISAQDGEIDTVNGGPGADGCTVDTGVLTDAVFFCEP